jgi:hypothetical protein
LLKPILIFKFTLATSYFFFRASSYLPFGAGVSLRADIAPLVWRFLNLSDSEIQGATLNLNYPFAGQTCLYPVGTEAI